MQRRVWWTLLLAALVTGFSSAQTAPQPAHPPRQSPPQPWTWEQVKDRFELNNPTLLADKLNIDESKAQEITAFFRPNPDFNLSIDGTQIAPEKGVWRPFAGTFESPGISYLHERRHKRELRHGERKNGNTDRRVQPRRPGTNLALQLAQRLCVRPCRPKPCCSWPRITWFTTTMCSRSAEAASMPATLRKSISTAWSCSACSMNRICKLPK